MNVSNLGAFFPIFAEKNDWAGEKKLGDDDVALIISFFSISQVIFSPFISKIKNRIGTKNTILLGLTLTMGSTMGLGYLAIIKQSSKFKYISLALRFVQGAGDIII